MLHASSAGRIALHDVTQSRQWLKLAGMIHILKTTDPSWQGKRVEAFHVPCCLLLASAAQMSSHTVFQSLMKVSITDASLSGPLVIPAEGSHRPFSSLEPHTPHNRHTADSAP